MTMRVKTYAYCVTCKNHVKLKDWYIETMNDTPALKGTCINCERIIMRPLTKEEKEGTVKNV